MADTVVRPSEESIRAAFAEAKKEDAYWQEHYQELIGRYPDQFVAVARANGEVVVTDPDLYGLLDALEAARIPVQQVWVKFIAATPIHLML